MNNSKEAGDLARTLLDSTGHHVAQHIDNEKNMWAYARAMSRCQFICSEYESGNDMELMEHKLIALRYHAGRHLKKRWFSREDHFYTLGIEHAIEIVNSIITRFVKGYSSDDTFATSSLLEGSGNGHQVCACLDGFGQAKR